MARVAARLASPSRRSARSFMGLWAAPLLLAQGCATVVMAGKDGHGEQTQAQSLLRLAADDVRETEWPALSEISIGARLAGVLAKDEDAITRSDAVDAYVEILLGAPTPAEQLMKDADTHLAAGDALAAAAQRAAYSPKPGMSDVALVETAIGDLRQIRDIYLVSLKRVSYDETASRKNARLLKSDFSRVIRSVGEAADLLADRVAADRARLMAKPKTQSFLASGSS